MNIWLLTNEFPPFFGGGIGTYSKALVNLLCSNGHKVTVILADEKNINRPVKTKLKHNLTLFRFPLYLDHKTESGFYDYHWQLQYPYRYCESVLALLATEEKPDIIESQDIMALSYLLLNKKKQGHPLLKEIPIVIYLHTPLYLVNQQNHRSNYRNDYYQLRKMEIESCYLADAVHCPSEYLKNHLQKTDLPNIDITVLRLPLPENHRVSPVNYFNSFTLVPHKIDLIYVGRLEYRKGCFQLVESCAALWRKGFKFNLVVIGRDDTHPGEQRSVKELLSENHQEFINKGFLTFIEQSPPQVVKALLKRARIFVMPSLFENFPYVCIEAILAKKIILASTTGGQSEMVGSDKKSGLVFDWENPEELSFKIMQALWLTKPKQKAMVKNALKRLQGLCANSKILKEKLGFYHQVIKKTKETISPVNPAAPKPLLSIIINFNENPEHFLETLHTLLQSEYKNIEIIVLYNPLEFTDKHQDILNTVLALATEKLLFIKYADDKFPLVKGIAHSKGLYFCYISNGLLIAKDYIARAIAILETDRTKDLIYGWSTEPFYKKVNQHLKLELPWLYASDEIPYAAIVRTSVFEKLLGPNINLIDLRDLYLSLVTKGVHSEVIYEVLVICLVPYVNSATYFRNMSNLSALVKKHYPAFIEHGVEYFKLLQITYPGK